LGQDGAGFLRAQLDLGQDDYSVQGLQGDLFGYPTIFSVQGGHQTAKQAGSHVIGVALKIRRQG
jgi:hypothetical protein